jgi:GMP synthase (glutamine-hydrolysing)
MSDTTEILILQHVEPEPPGRIAAHLRKQNVPYRTVRIFQDDPVPDDLAGASGLVVMGGPMGVGDLDGRPHLRKECRLIEDALQSDRPVLGVCLGSQLLAHVLGADVTSAPAKEIGWGDVMLTEAASEDALWRGVPSPFPALHWHGDVFELPDGAVRLARSQRTECQAFRYGNSAYGLLFHLEVTPEIVGGMTRAFADELNAADLDGEAIREAASAHDRSIQAVADTVFGGWTERVKPL